MTTSVRALLAALMATILATPLLIASPAAADPKPDLGQAWPFCGTGTDTDGWYCVVSVTRNGVPYSRTQPDYGTPGDYLVPYIDLIGSGDIRFGINHWVIDAALHATIIGDIPQDTWEWTVNTGTINPVEMYGQLRNPRLSFGGNATTGYTFTLGLEPAPMAWRWDASGMLPCSYDAGCGDDTTVAGLVYTGFVTGYVTDDAGRGYSAIERGWRRGYINSYNAQDAYWFYDFDTNALVVRMANPHLSSPGVPATGYFETFIPDGMLIHEYSVPDPTTLSRGSFAVSRTGSAAAVPFTVTREPGGIRIRLTGITFSTPQYRIRPKASAPGAPRWGSITRPSKTKVKVTFRRPVATGGKPITLYVVQCRRGSHTWRAILGTKQPVTFTRMPRGPVTCRVRARNVVGLGVWSPAHTG